MYTIHVSLHTKNLVQLLFIEKAEPGLLIITGEIFTQFEVTPYRRTVY